MMYLYLKTLDGQTPLGCTNYEQVVKLSVPVKGCHYLRASRWAVGRQYMLAGSVVHRTGMGQCLLEAYRGHIG